MSNLLRLADDLSSALAGLHFAPPVAYVYNPLVYARAAHARYLELYGEGRGRVVLLGMNPGPFGMAQTGVPFGEVGLVRDWLGIDVTVERPRHEHPKRPVLGFASTRSEVSGARVWGWARSRFGEPREFFARFFVANYCPLLFLESSGRNLTPDKLAARDREALTATCDSALRALFEDLQPRLVIGVGKYAEERARLAASGLAVRVGGILHPSPASPAANRGWEEAATRQLEALGAL